MPCSASRFVIRAAGLLTLTLGSLACRGSSKESRARAEPPPTTAPSTTPSSPVEASPAASVSPSPTFAVVARLAPNVETRFFALGRHVALWQRSTNEPYVWSLTAMGGGTRPVDIAKGLRKRIVDDGMELLFAGGTGPDDAWLVTSYVVKDSAMAFAMETWHTTGGSLKSTNQPAYRFVGEFRKGQWVGVPFDVHPGYLLDDPPRAFRNVTGQAPPPKLPAGLSLFKAAFVGEGRACGLGARVGDAGDASEMLLWVTGPEGSRVLSLGPLDQAATVVAANRECVVVTPQKDEKDGTKLERARGSSLTTVRIGPHASAIAGASEGSIWIVHDHVLARVTLTESSAQSNDVALATTPACPSPVVVSDVVALADDDVWVTAACDKQVYVLHTQAPPSNVDALPSP